MLPDAWKTLLLGSLNGDLESHPGHRLTDHLLESCRLAEALLKQHSLGTRYEKTVVPAAVTHDAAKAQKAFQEHLHGGKGVEHAAPSAFFSLPLTKDGEISDAFITAEAVRRHHTHLQNWNDIKTVWAKDGFMKWLSEMRLLIPDWEWEGCDAIAEDIRDFLFDNVPEDGVNEAEIAGYWFRLRTTLSLLVAADRMNAVGITYTEFQPLPDFQEKSFIVRGRVDLWRGETAKECFKNIKSLDMTEGIYTLTLPTGAGKTNIGLRSAHMIAKKLGYETIIYALPFISVVEQNADFAREVFGEDYVQEDHSLALISKDGREGAAEKIQEKPWKRLSTLFRYWNSPVITTTMVQLWDAIYNPKATASMDFHRLSRAVVVLDEPQGIDSRHWYEFGKTLSYISKNFGTVFVLMTATQPVMVQEAKELAPKTAFPVSRHGYKFIGSGYQLSELPELLRGDRVDFAEKSGMVVLNTRRAALDAYRVLREFLGENTYVLSGWMTSEHKRRVIKKIASHIKAGELCHLIATQTVEAGVDLDFEWVFRDVGPLDSIIQAAGRCNRSGLHERGLVMIAELNNSSGKPYASMVYDSVTLDTTKEFLHKYPEFDDGEVTAIVEEYYDELTSKIKNNSMWKRIEEGEWEDFTPLFKNEREEVPVYVDNGRIDTLLAELRNLKPSLENREKIKSLRNELSQYSFGADRKLMNKCRESIVETSIIGGSQTKIEEIGDMEYYIIRRDGIGESDTSVYHTAAGFQPQDEPACDDIW
ncbi:CRISPR-associated helicase/endonuclease Cas3 [Synergistes jonesii]|nr:CRISPR-associated helicase/endonuclease Cas3 [Synergistes jonesii]